MAMRSRHRDDDTGLLPITDLEDLAPSWPGATWVGQLDEAVLPGSDRLALSGGAPFSRARILVRAGAAPRGFVEVPVTNGSVDAGYVARQVGKLPPARPGGGTTTRPPVTVAVCTDDRPARLREVLVTLGELDYPQLEVLVLDRNPASGLTAPVVADASIGATFRIELVGVPGAGESQARNAALLRARHDLVAFTDDDASVDRHWLTNLASGFGRSEDVVCVTGTVPTAELVTPAQCYADRRAAKVAQQDPVVLDLARPPTDAPFFPVDVSRYGSGANVAVRRDVVVALGGFDEGLGGGTATGGGADVDLFVRLLLAGHVLVHEPAAVVWKRAPRDAAGLAADLRTERVGLGAVVAKLAARPETLRVAKRTRPAPARTVSLGPSEVHDLIDHDPDLAGLDRAVRRPVLSGALRLLRARYDGGAGYPLLVDPSVEPDVPAPARGRDRRGARRAGLAPHHRDARIGLAVGLLGLVAVVPQLPQVAVAVAVGLFVLVGPGSTITSWYAGIPAAARLLLVPTLSLAVAVVTVGGGLLLGYYDPRLTLLVLAGTVVGVNAVCVAVRLLKSRREKLA